MTTVELPFADARAEAELEEFFDGTSHSFAQQTAAWRAVIAQLGVDEPLTIGCRRGERLVGVLPAFLYEGPLGSVLTSAPQAGALGGVACADDVDPAPVYAALLEEFVELARRRGCAVATVVSSPFWPDKELYDRFFGPDYTLENRCQVLELDDGVDASGAFPHASQNVRRNLRKAESVPQEIDEAQTQSNVDEWYEVHAARHREIGAVPLPKGLFDAALHEMVPRGKARFVFVRATEGSRDILAGGFYVLHGQVVDALMPSASSAHDKWASNYLLAAHTLRWAKACGLRYHNWQGSPPGSGVERFKRQWGSRDFVYYWMTRVTGDVQPLLCSSPETVREAYRWHFVLPYDRIGAPPGDEGTHSTRADAWQASSPK